MAAEYATHPYRRILIRKLALHTKRSWCVYDWRDNRYAPVIHVRTQAAAIFYADRLVRGD